jgi:uncharacterized membrane protein
MTQGQGLNTIANWTRDADRSMKSSRKEGTGAGLEHCAGTAQHGANTASCLGTLSFTLSPAKVQIDGMRWSGLRVRLV